MDELKAQLIAEHAALVEQHAETLSRTREGLAMVSETLLGILVGIAESTITHDEMIERLDAMAGALNSYYLNG